jgi:hypothetical protein
MKSIDLHKISIKEFNDNNKAVYTNVFQWNDP